MKNDPRLAISTHPAEIERLLAALERDGFAVTRTSLEEFDALATRLGTSVPVRRGGPTTDRLMPTPPDEAAPRSLSAIYGLGTFPFHTDAAHHRVPPRYLLMRLADGAASTTPTLLVDADPRSFRLPHSKTLTRKTWLVRGGLGRTFYAPILDPSRRFLRFDPGCMSPPAGTFLKGQEILTRRLALSRQELEIEWATDTTLVADNWRVLHSRPSIPAGDTSRVLLRKLLT